MAITTKNRKELKSYFAKNAIPTESNFAELVDAPLNQADDGVFKLAGEPFSVVAAAGGQKRVLRLYGEYPAAVPDWLISLNPAQDPADAATNRAGFGIADGTGNTRLFIDPANGNLGIGTNNPSERLHVNGGDMRIEGGRYRRLKIVSDKYWAGIELVAREQGEAGNPFIDFTHGQLDAPDFGIRTVATDNNTLRIEAGTGDAALDVRGSIRYSATQSKLDVAEQNAATIRASDLAFGHSSRRGSPGRALVDAGISLILNYATDWPLAEIRSPLSVGNVCIGANSTKYPLDVRVPGGTNTWDRFVVTTSGAWGDTGSQYVTVGAGGAAGIMFWNPHVPWQASEARASIRYGRTGGAAGKTYWDAGVRADGRFTFNALEDGGVGETLGIGKTGTVGIPRDLEIEGSAGLGWARSNNDFNAPMRTGFYQFDNPAGRVPDNSHGWVHMIAVRHSNASNNHQLQIAGSYAENDKLYFRKIARTLDDAGRPGWNEVATAAAMPKIRSGVTPRLPITNGSGSRQAFVQVSFGYTFASPPTVAVMLSAMDTDQSRNVRLAVAADLVTTTGCRIVFTTWADTIIWGTAATWIAIGV